jgi:hypothetical protein
LDGRENGQTVFIYCPPKKVNNGSYMLYGAGNCTSGQMTGKWYAYDKNGDKIGYLKSKSGGG